MTKKRFLVFFVAAIMAISVGCLAFTGCGSPVEKIKISTKPTKIDYVVGETLDLSGMVVTADREDGSQTELAASEYTVVPAAGTKLGETDTKIVVTYQDLTADFKITVHNKVTSVALKTPPSKTTYWAGEEKFDPTGMVLTATKEDGSKEDVTVKGNKNVTVEDRTLSTAGNTDEKQTISVTYGGKSYNQEITVKANPVTDLVVKTPPTKTEYYRGQKFDPAGMVLTATYKSGKKADINAATDSGVTYSKKELTEADTNITVSFGGREVSVTIGFEKGIFIEAESGRITSTTVDYLTDAVISETDPDSGETIETNTATGGMYVGDMKAGDTVDFEFNADKAGVIKANFRMASQYLKKDSNWTPIWMGDCQFNKICKVYVNGVQYTIPDSIVLPGGGSEDGEPDKTLWFNWQEVDFENINVKQGNNVIRLEYIKHNYTDTSQSSFSGAFTANLDSLKVLPGNSGIELSNYDYASVVDNEFITYEEKAADDTGANQFALDADGAYKMTAKKSSFANRKAIWAKDAVSNGGKADGYNGWGGLADGNSVEFNFNMAADGKADMDFIAASANWSNEISGNTPTDDLSNYVDIFINNRRYDISDTNLPCSDKGKWDEYQHIVFKDVTVFKGSNSFRMVRRTGVCPNISRLEIFSNQEFIDLKSLSAAEDKFVWLLNKTFDPSVVNVTATLTDNSTIENVSGLKAVKLDGKAETEFKFTEAKDYTVTLAYTLSGVTKELDVTVTVIDAKVTATAVDIKAAGDKAVYVINGTYTGCSAEQLEKISIHFDLQRNATASGGGNWTTYYPSGTTTAKADGTYSTEYDVTDLANAKYTTHYGYKDDGSAGADLKLGIDFSKLVTVGGKDYLLTSVKSSSDAMEFWGCVGLTIGNPSYKITKMPSKTSYEEGEAFDKSGMEVSALHVDGSTVALNASEYAVTASGDIATVTIGEKVLKFVYKKSDIAVNNIGEQSWIGDSAAKDILAAGSWDNAYDSSKTDVPVIDAEKGTVTFKSTTGCNRMNSLVIKHKDNADGNNIGAEVNGNVDGVEHIHSLNVKADGAFNIGLLLAKGLKNDFTGGGQGLALKFAADGTVSIASAKGGLNVDLANGAALYKMGQVNRVDFTLTRMENKVTLKVYVNGMRVYFNDANMSSHRNTAIEDGNFTFMAGSVKNDGTKSGYDNYGNRMGIFALGDTTVELSKVVSA